jgi:hypothetical protein
MPVLGTMLVERDIVHTGLSMIRSNLTELHINATALEQAAESWSRGYLGTSRLLRQLSGGDDPEERALRTYLAGLRDRKKRIIKDIHLWIETSFDAATQADLKERFFPLRHVFFVGGGVDSGARDLLNDVKQLIDEAEDIERRLGHFSAPNSSPAAPTPSASVLTPASRDSIFVAYSHDDRGWLERLKKHLRPLARGGTLELWEDTQLRPGTQWREEIEHALGRATVAVLLVSADFLASDFIAGIELPTILTAEKNRGLAVVPVFVAPCEVPEDILQFQGVNDPSKTLEESTKPEADRVLTKLVHLMRERLI